MTADCKNDCVGKKTAKIIASNIQNGTWEKRQC